jgi:hypothetical protein
MGAMFGGGMPAATPMMAPPQPAKVEPPIVMPIKDDLVDRQYEQKKAALDRRGKTGRANTIIGADDTLGG